MDELTREFLIESQEVLDRMERCLTDLEDAPENAELLAEIFRAVHTIKGTTGFLGFKRLEKLAHAGESLLGLLRDGKRTADAAVITSLLELLDRLRLILKAIETDGDEGEQAGAGADAELIDRLQELQMQAEIAVWAGMAKRGAKPGAKPKAKRREQGSGNREQKAGTRDKGPIDRRPAERGPDEVQAKGAENIPEVTRDVVPAAAAKAAASGAVESTLRVDITLLNRMMNLVGELVLTRNQVLQATASDARMTMLSRRLDMVTADLRESVMKARMQPVSNVFSKMPRMVRDLSQALGRKVRLEMKGQETELDKSLLEAIKDPLTHAVRNAMDHGIEAPDVRSAAGKDPEGTLKLRAFQEGSHVIVEVSDDGAGISVDRIREKALERGLITRERAAQSSERELLQLIFLPGFSTAAQVTNVSGRGVGMDVVRTNVEKIGGKVEIESRVGTGTTLRLRIPLTLAIVPALIVRSLGQSFALPQGALSELVHVGPEQSDKAIEWIEDAPLYRLRGKFLPLVFLDRLLLPPEEGRTRDRRRDSFIAVLDADGRRYGLVVDGLADPEEIVVKPLSPVLKDIGLYSGATVLGNAELALILDPGAIAVKAGIALREENLHGADGENETEAAGRMEYLLVSIAGRQAAVRLQHVLRIEQVPAARIEYAGMRPLLNFAGQLLPVEDAGGLIGAAEGRPDTRIIVVVCRDSGRQVGIVVEHVLDVAAGGDLVQAGNSRAANKLTLLREKVTGVVDLQGVADLEEEPLLAASY